METAHQKNRRYTYWLDTPCLADLKREMEGECVEMTCAQYSPCETLKSSIGYDGRLFTQSLLSG